MDAALWIDKIDCAKMPLETNHLQRRRSKMENLIGIIMVIFMAVLGGVPTLYLVISLPIVIVQKIIGKIRYGKSLYA